MRSAQTAAWWNLMLMGAARPGTELI
jgi:hypothetical protein